MYKYLGVCFTTRLTFSTILNDLADRARKGMLAIMKLVWSIGEHSPEIFFKILIARYSLFWLMVPKYVDFQITRKVSKEYIYQLWKGFGVSTQSLPDI